MRDSSRTDGLSFPAAALRISSNSSTLDLFAIGPRLQPTGHRTVDPAIAESQVGPKQMITVGPHQVRACNAPRCIDTIHLTMHRPRRPCLDGPPRRPHGGSADARARHPRASSRARRCTATRSASACATSSGSLERVVRLAVPGPVPPRAVRGGAGRPRTPGQRSAPVPMTGSLSGERAALRARRSGRASGAGAARSTGSPTRGAGSSPSSSTATAPAATTTPAASACGWPSPATCPPRPACGSSSGGAGQLVQRLAEARAAAAAAEGRLDTYARSLMEHTTESTERDIAWLDRLIEAERARPTRRDRRPRRAAATGAGRQASECTTSLEEGDTT